MKKIILIISIVILLSSCSIKSGDSNDDLFSKKKACYESMLEYRKNFMPEYNYESEDYEQTSSINDWFYSKSKNTCYINRYTRANESGKIINTHALFDLYNSSNYHHFSSRNMTGDEYSEAYDYFQKSVIELKRGE